MDPSAESSGGRKSGGNHPPVTVANPSPNLCRSARVRPPSHRPHAARELKFGRINRGLALRVRRREYKVRRGVVLLDSASDDSTDSCEDRDMGGVEPVHFPPAAEEHPTDVNAAAEPELIILSSQEAEDAEIIDPLFEEKRPSGIDATSSPPSVNKP